ncbi:AbiV family abortive infection protein, partial [Pseudomonas juntendi]
MASRKLDGYKGRLNCSQLAAGMTAARANAARLAKDARLLLGAEGFASAASLAALSLEEARKISILRGMALELEDSAIKAEWKHYRSHTSKNSHWTFPALVADGA